MIFRWW